MNEIQYLNLEDPAEVQGFRVIPVTLGTHPYISAWWPPGHIIGYEHTFLHVVKEFTEALAGDKNITPNLWDGVKIIQVLEAGLLSDKEGRKVMVSEIR